MRQAPRDQRVFVVAPGPVVLFFPKVRKLLADLPLMENSERDAARFFSVNGEVLALFGGPERGFHLGMTGEFDREGLRSALAAVANDPKAETAPDAVAAQLAGRRPRRSFGRRRR